MMFEKQLVDTSTSRGFRAGDADKRHDRAVAAGLGEKFAKFPLRVKPVLLEARDDAHPPDTGGRNSRASPAPGL